MTALLAAGLLVGGASAANAGTTLLSYNMVIPKFEGAVKSAAQIKAIYAHPAYVQTGTIGGGYNANARVCKTGTVTCGTTLANLYSYGYANLANTFSVGQSTQLQLWLTTFSFVDVQATGYWASN